MPTRPPIEVWLRRVCLESVKRTKAAGFSTTEQPGMTCCSFFFGKDHVEKPQRENVQEFQNDHRHRHREFQGHPRAS
jgi:hypothetical protein